jgi:hypothetical protein
MGVVFALDLVPRRDQLQRSGDYTIIKMAVPIRNNRNLLNSIKVGGGFQRSNRRVVDEEGSPVAVVA